MNKNVSIIDFKAGDDVPEWIEHVIADDNIKVSIKFGMDVVVECTNSNDDFSVGVFPKYNITNEKLSDGLIQIKVMPKDAHVQISGAPTHIFRYPRGDIRNNL